VMKFLDYYVGKFDMYVEDEYAVFVRYCFADPGDAAASARGLSRSQSALSLPAERLYWRDVRAVHAKLHVAGNP
jgi:hypothetical protein